METGTDGLELPGWQTYCRGLDDTVAEWFPCLSQETERSHLVPLLAWWYYARENAGLAEGGEKQMDPRLGKHVVRPAPPPHRGNGTASRCVPLPWRKKGGCVVGEITIYSC